MDEVVGDSVDEKTGLPIHSLYGQTRQPSPEQLRDLDALVFDIQDIGCRFYTYISTMGLAMEAAAKSGKKMFILDRVNPIGGIVFDGPAECGPSSFTALPSDRGAAWDDGGGVGWDVQHRAGDQVRPHGNPARRLVARILVRSNRAAMVEPITQHAGSHRSHPLSWSRSVGNHRPLGRPRYRHPVRGGGRALHRRHEACRTS